MAFLATQQVSVASLVPVAITRSVMSMLVLLDDLFLAPSPQAIAGASTATFSSTVAMSPESGHVASAQIGTATTKSPDIATGGLYLAPTPIAAIQTNTWTLAAAGSYGALFGRSAALGTAGIRGLTVVSYPPVTGPAPQVTLIWDVEQLTLQTAPYTSLALMETTVDVIRKYDDLEELIQFGILLSVEDGKETIDCRDPPNNEALSTWCKENLTTNENGISLKDNPDRIVIQVPMDALFPSGIDVFELAIQVTHAEMSAEAPPMPVLRVAEQAGHQGSGESGPQIHWDAASQMLTIDPLPINLVTDATAVAVGSHYPGDPLLGGLLEIDPLQFVAAYGDSRYFTGDEVRLIGSTGEVLFRASLPSIVFNDEIYSDQGFDLFAPLLNLIDMETGSSEWIQDYAERASIESFYLSELFMGFDPAAIIGGSWDVDFHAPVNAVVSFAGPIATPTTEAVPEPGVSVLICIGWGILFVTRTGTRKHRNGTGLAVGTHAES